MQKTVKILLICALIILFGLALIAFAAQNDAKKQVRNSLPRVPGVPNAGYPPPKE